MVTRWIAALAAFLIVAAIGVVLAGGIPEVGEADPVTFAFQAVANVLALILGAALLAAIAYAVVERIQTGSNAQVNPVHDADADPDPDRDCAEHHPRPDRRGGAEDPDLPRLIGTILAACAGGPWPAWPLGFSPTCCGRT